jgi:hypothetical protein
MTHETKIENLQDLGLTHRQARFLVTVMQHSGVCVPRQYASFAGTAYGQRVNRFFDHLVRKGFAVPCACVHNRARVFHVQHRALYTAIGEPHSRFRRPVPAARVVERLMRLDAVLPLTDMDWLSTEAEKVAHVTTICGVDAACLPRAGRGRGATTGARAFPDGWPLGIDRDGHIVFVYLASAVDETDGLRLFLHRHLDLWRALPSWTLRLVLPRRLGDSRDDYQSVIEDELERLLDPLSIDTLRTTFEGLKATSSHMRSIVEEELHVQAVLRLPRLVALYSRWLRNGDCVLTDASSRVLADALETGRARVDSVVLAHDYRHLSPLVAGRVGRAERVEKGATEGDRCPGRPQPPSSPDEDGAANAPDVSMAVALDASNHPCSSDLHDDTSALAGGDLSRPSSERVSQQV